jgi:predicted GTPase
VQKFGLKQRHHHQHHVLERRMPMATMVMIDRVETQTKNMQVRKIELQVNLEG